MVEVQPFAAVCNRDLGIKDHYAVYSKVKTLSARWKPFAQSLHLEQDKIDIIEKDHGKECESCMSKALNQWLKRNYEYKIYGTPCWRLVCIAVEEGGGDAALAGEIASEHPLAAGVASPSIYVSSERNYALLKRLYDLQEEFADVLEETEECFSTLTDPDLLPRIINYLVRHIITVLGPYRNNRTTALAVTQEFQCVKAIPELFNLLQLKYLSWFNYKLVVKLTKKFVMETHSVQEAWWSYEQKLKDYFINSGCLLKDAEAVQFGNFNRPPSPATKIMIAKVDRDDYTLDDIFFFHKAIPEELNVTEYELYFSFVYTSSLCLEYWIPDFLYSVLFPLSIKKQQQLAGIGITELSCDEYSYDLKKSCVALQLNSSILCQKFTASKEIHHLPEHAQMIKMWLGEIENKLLNCYSKLDNRLDGLDDFTERMVSNNLIVATSDYRNFDAIMSEFKTKLQRSISMWELRNTYKTFIKVLENSKIDVNDFQLIVINWSVSKSGKIESYDIKAIKAEDHDFSLQSQSDIKIEKENESQLNSRPASSRCVTGKKFDEWAIVTKMAMAQQTLHQQAMEESGPVLYLQNGFKKTILLRDKPIRKPYQLSLTKLKEIISNETISCNFFLVNFLGPEKSTLILNFLKNALYAIPHWLKPLSTLEHNEKGLSVYNVTLVQHEHDDECLWLAPTKVLNEARSCGSAILHMGILHCYDIELQFKGTSDVFGERILDGHLDLVCKNMEQIIQYNYELQQILSSEAFHINILDNGFGKGAMEFVTLIFHHTSNNLGFICLTMNDVKELEKSFHERQKDTTGNLPAVRKELRISHFLQHAAEMFFKSPITFIIICSEQDSINDRKKAEEILYQAIEKETAWLELESFQASVLVLDLSSFDDMKKLNQALDKEVKAQCQVKRNIKLSWIFLHSALSSSSDVIISYSKLKDIAEKLNIKEIEYKEFLETFTKFMSILYLPTFKPLENFVILRPVEFINKLSTLFRTPGGKEFNGIYTMEQLIETFANKELTDAIVSTLNTFGLALETKSDKVDKRTSELCHPPISLIFIPLARSGHISVSERLFLTSLFILFNSKTPLPDCQSFFASELLKLRGSSLLTGSNYKYQPNVFKILIQTTRQECIISFIWQGTYIEVAIDYDELTSELLNKVLQCCREALAKMSSILRKFSYKFALQCVTPDHKSTTNYIDPAKRVFEVFPKSQLCHHCEALSSPLRKKWKEVLQKMHDNEEKRKDRVNIENLLILAQDLGQVIKTSQSLAALATQLGVRLERDYLMVLSQSCSQWQRVFMVLLLWEKKAGATKEKLKSALTRLGYPTKVLD